MAWGPAAKSSGAPPYWPWRQVLRVVSASVDVVKIADELGVLPDLVRLAPEVFGAPGGDRDGSGSSEDRFRLFDAVVRLLSDITASAPWAVVFDDAHRADIGSLLLLHHVVRTLTGERLLVMVNHRDTEPVHDVLVTGLAREPVTRRIDLRGLATPAVGKQLTALVGGAVAPAQVQRVHAVTGGNPFFVSEMGWALADAGPAASPVPVPPSVLQTINERLERLPPKSVWLLRAASIVGREFSVELLARMVGEPVLGCLGQLDERSGRPSGRVHRDARRAPIPARAGSGRDRGRLGHSRAGTATPVGGRGRGGAVRRPSRAASVGSRPALGGCGGARRTGPRYRLD
ncbi:MAG: hypothetical protein LC749_11665 [Actinobacteria bacterium]|nr:hypothetical protein [Actinomycetota bacterium]